MAIWEKDVAAKLNGITGAYDDTMLTSEVVTEAPVEPSGVELLPPPKRAKEDRERSFMLKSVIALLPRQFCP